MGRRDSMHMGECGVPEPSVIWPVPHREVPCGICDFQGTISSVDMSFPDVVGAGAVANLSVCGLITAGTFNAAVQYILLQQTVKLVVKMHPTHRSFSTFSTDYPRDLFAIFHHGSKRSIKWSWCHDISKTCLVISVNLYHLLFARWSSRF